MAPGASFRLLLEEAALPLVRERLCKWPAGTTDSRKTTVSGEAISCGKHGGSWGAGGEPLGEWRWGEATLQQGDPSRGLGHSLHLDLVNYLRAYN